MEVWQILLVIVFLSISVMLILENRHPTKSVAWMMALTFLPGVGLILFTHLRS